MHMRVRMFMFMPIRKTMTIVFVRIEGVPGMVRRSSVIGRKGVFR